MSEEIKHDPFPSNQKVYIIDDDQSELTVISENLIPPLEKIDSITDLSTALTKRLSDVGNYATLIIGSKLPPKINDNFNQLVQALNSLNNQKESKKFYHSVLVIRIGKQNEDKTFENTIANFRNVSEFIDNISMLSAKGITQNLDVSDDARKLINRLETSNGRYKARLNELLDDKDKKEKKLKELQDELQTVKTQTEIAEQKMTKAKEISANAKEEVKKSSETIEVLERQTEKDAKKIKDLNLKISKYETQIDADTQNISELNASINALNQKIFDLKDEITELRTENDDLTEQQSDIQQVAKLRQNNRNLNDENEKLNDEIRDLKSKLIVKNSQVDQLEKRLANFRNGQDDLLTTGTLRHLPIISLNQTDVLYFKVISEPNYFKTLLNFLYNNVIINGLGGKDFVSQMVILRQDNEGLDDKIFKGMPIVDDLGKLIQPNEKSRLLATPKMAGHTKVFENNNNFLVFVDYINSNQTYIETKASMLNFVVTHTFDEFKNSELGGHPINQDKRNSVFDLTYLPDFKDLTKQNFENEMINRLSAFLDLPTMTKIMQKYLK